MKSIHFNEQAPAFLLNGLRFGEAELIIRHYLIAN